MKLGPCCPLGVYHWKGVPSLNQGVRPPCRWVTIRLCGRSPTITPFGPAMIVGSTGKMCREGSRFFTVKITGLFRVATIAPPRYF